MAKLVMMPGADLNFQNNDGPQLRCLTAAFFCHPDIAK